MLDHIHIPHGPHHTDHADHDNTIDEDQSLISIALALATSQIINIVESEKWEWEAGPENPNSRPMLRRSVSLMTIAKKDQFRWSLRSDISEGSTVDNEQGRVFNPPTVPKREGLRWSMTSDLSEDLGVEEEVGLDIEEQKDGTVSVVKEASSAEDEKKELMRTVANISVEEDDGLDWIVNSYLDRLSHDERQDHMPVQESTRTVVHEEDAVADLIGPNALKTLRQGRDKGQLEKARDVMLVRKVSVRPRDIHRCAAVIESPGLERDYSYEEMFRKLV